MNIHKVILVKDAKKDLEKVPTHIAVKLYEWVEAVTHDGLMKVRKITGFHDEPLQGKRKGQRSIRLSKGYRALYEIARDGKMEIVEIVEVNKHDY